ncbi:MAG: SpoIIE family protein phosphatase [Christensenellales bacterium]
MKSRSIKAAKPLGTRTARNRINITPFAVLKYAAFFLSFVFFSRATLFEFSPFALGLFVGLVYSRQNILILTPLYVLASLTMSFNLYTLLYTTVPAIILIGCYYACYKLSKRVTLLVLALCTLVGQLPYLIISCVVKAAYFEAIFTIALGIMFSFVSEIACYALVLRGLNYHLSTDERICLSLLLSVLSLGIYKLPIGGFNLFYMFAAIVSMFFIMNFSKDVALIVGISMGAGAYLAGGELGIASLVALWTALALPFKDLSKFAAASAIMIVNTLIELYIDKTAFDYLEIISVMSGLIIYLAVPKKFVCKAAQKMGGLSHKIASRNIVNNSRKELGDKLGSVSNVFLGMKDILTKTSHCYNDLNPWSLADTVAKASCSKCSNLNACNAKIGSPSKEIIPLVQAGMSKGKITILDTPPHISKNCIKQKELTKNVMSVCECAKNKLSTMQAANESKMLLAEQFGAVGTMLGELCRDVKKRVSFDMERENRIISELARHNIIAEEAVVHGERQNVSVTLVVREEDYNKVILEKIVSKVLKAKMERQKTEMTHGEWRTLYLSSSPYYTMAIGSAQKAKAGNTSCGDTFSLVKLECGKIMVALSDGMGQGFSAHTASDDAITLVENFYKAGLKSDLILPLVNKLLTLKEADDYSTLDVGVVDLNSGYLDVIKLGSSPTFILSNGNLVKIDSNALPIGILDRINPTTQTVKLSPYDLVIMVTDGIIDALNEKSLSDILCDEKSFNPQALCDRLIEAAESHGLNDDATAIAFRIAKTA